MSPLFVPIILAIFAGVVLLVIGVIKRKKTFIIIGAPAAALLLGWLIMASIPPAPEKEFDRIFGGSNRSAAADIDTIKPTMMDGHFITFRMSQGEFDTLIRPQFEETDFTNFDLLRKQSLPSGWPQSVADATAALHKELNYQEILVYYDVPTETAYASVLYDQW
jgi:hypothetical protein